MSYNRFPIPICTGNGKLTMDDVKEICSYAREYQMEIIGSFQCFGHFEKILSLEKYAPLGDTPSMIAPLKPQAQAFLKSVIEELADAFSSDYFNINCDETWDWRMASLKNMCVG